MAGRPTTDTPAPNGASVGAEHRALFRGARHRNPRWPCSAALRWFYRRPPLICSMPAPICQALVSLASESKDAIAASNPRRWLTRSASSWGSISPVHEASAIWASSWIWPRLASWHGLLHGVGCRIVRLPMIRWPTEQPNLPELPQTFFVVMGT